MTVLGLSGGVDSALALLRLCEADTPVQPVFMKNWEEDDDDEFCSASADLADAQSVCDALGLPLRTVNLSHEFWEQVFEEFLAEIRAGRTPNPDVVCNQEVKFKAFMDYASDLGADGIATGHYARLEQRADGVALLRAADENKDQTYFLHRLTQAQLARAQFPIGDLCKDDVRARAAAAGLSVSGKRDSTGICFVGERPFAEFLARYVPKHHGPICSVDGVELGQHTGLAFYTIGQRQGLGIGGRTGGDGKPWYVAEKRLEDNTLVVAQGNDHPALWGRSLAASNTHWIAAVAPPLPARLGARIRHRQQIAPCYVKDTGVSTLQVDFDTPQWAIAAGQYVVFYLDNECLGGAVIERGW